MFGGEGAIVLALGEVNSPERLISSEEKRKDERRDARLIDLHFGFEVEDLAN